MKQELEDNYFDDDENPAHDDCPKCNRRYDDIDYEYQSCSKCGWDVQTQKYGKRREPTDADYLAGEADILTGRWW